MRKQTLAMIAVMVLGTMPAVAAPVQVDFNVAGFGPVVGTTNTFTKADVMGDLDITFQSLNQALLPDFSLYWDANDGGGYADGFGVVGGGYENDEIEGDERLALWFSEPVTLLGANLTDLFKESVPVGSCPSPGCYNEWGAVMFRYADGTQSLFRTFSAPDSSALGSTNGMLDLVLNERNVVGIIFQAPGEIFGGVPAGFRELHEFSVAGLRFDDDKPAPVPEPGTMLLLSTGLLVAVVRRRRVKA